MSRLQSHTVIYTRRLSPRVHHCGRTWSGCSNQKSIGEFIMDTYIPVCAIRYPHCCNNSAIVLRLQQPDVLGTTRFTCGTTILLYVPVLAPIHIHGLVEIMTCWKDQTITFPPWFSHDSRAEINKTPSTLRQERAPSGIDGTSGN